MKYFKRVKEVLIENINRYIEGAKGEVSLVLKDLTNDKWIYTLNGNKPVQSASTIKVLIMVEALNQVLQGKYSLNQIIDIREEYKVKYSMITDMTLKSYPYLDLIILMNIVSDNTATNILIDLLGYENINEMARKLGLKNTVLRRKMEEFKAIKEGRDNYTSAMDMGVIMESLYRNLILTPEMCSLALDILKRQKYKDVLLRLISEDVKIAHKTGGLRNLSHDIGIFYLDSVDYLLGVFVTEAESDVEAKEIIGKISKVVYNYFTIPNKE